jgi:hypothetical protein
MRGRSQNASLSRLPVFCSTSASACRPTTAARSSSTLSSSARAAGLQMVCPAQQTRQPHPARCMQVQVRLHQGVCRGCVHADNAARAVGKRCACRCLGRATPLRCSFFVKYVHHVFTACTVVSGGRAHVPQRR